MLLTISSWCLWTNVCVGHDLVPGHRECVTFVWVEGHFPLMLRVEILSALFHFFYDLLSLAQYCS